MGWRPRHARRPRTRWQRSRGDFRGSASRRFVQRRLRARRMPFARCCDSVGERLGVGIRRVRAGAPGPSREQLHQPGLSWCATDACLRPLRVQRRSGCNGPPGTSAHDGAGDFDCRDILAEIEIAGDSVAIVTLAPELTGAHDLIRHLVAAGRRVSLGHSGATLEQGKSRHRGRCMPCDTSLQSHAAAQSSRSGARRSGARKRRDRRRDYLRRYPRASSDLVHLSISIKRAERVMAITDGTAVAGLPEGSPRQHLAAAALP